VTRFLQFQNSPIDGDDVREVLLYFPQLKDKFKQRKNYDEYYFEDCFIDLTLNVIDDLSLRTYVDIDFRTITIKNRYH